MNALIIAELILRIWLRILETTPDEVLKEQNTEAWKRFKAVLDWLATLDPKLPKLPES